MSSDEKFVETKQDLEDLVEQHNKLQEIAQWTHGILAVLLQEQGGVVEISEESLSSIDMSRSTLTVKFDDERKVYIVEGGESEV